MVKRNKKIVGHLELDEIKSVMKEYNDSYDLHIKLLVISMPYQGETISKSSDYVHTTRKTGEHWVKNYNEKGLEGLYSRKIITSSDESYFINVQRIIKDTFGVNHDYKTIWTIVHKKT